MNRISNFSNKLNMLKPSSRQQQARKPKSEANDGAFLALQAQQMQNRSRAVSSQSQSSSPKKTNKWASNNLFQGLSVATTNQSSRPATSQQNVRGHLGRLYPINPGKKKWQPPSAKGTRVVNPAKVAKDASASGSPRGILPEPR